MVKKGLSIILFLLLASGLRAQQNPQLQFEQANNMLQQGKIVQALAQYKQLIDKKKVSGALFINTAYTYMQLGKLGKAKYFFYKAKRFDETYEKAISGLNIVENKLSHQSIVLPTLPWEKVLNWLGVTLGPPLLLAIGLILINIGVFILVGGWLQKKHSTIIPKITTGVVAAGIIVLLLSFYTDYRQQRYSKAVMVTSKTNVVKKPAPEATLVHKAYEGYSFTVDHKKSRNHGQWVYVEMSDGSEGWIQRKEIMIL